MTSPRSEPNFPPASAILVQPSSPRFPTGGPHRRVGIAVDLSDESAFAVGWAVQNYLRPGDAVVLIHVSPTAVLYGADWGSAEAEADSEAGSDAFTAAKAIGVAEPLDRAEVPYRIHVVRDHDMKERLCLEVERLGLGALVMGSRGFGASKRAAADAKSRLGSVSDYCVHHCVCPVIVVRAAEDNYKDKPDEVPKDQDALDK